MKIICINLKLQLWIFHFSFFIFKTWRSPLIIWYVYLRSVLQTLNAWQKKMMAHEGSLALKQVESKSILPKISLFIVRYRRNIATINNLTVIFNRNTNTLNRTIICLKTHNWIDFRCALHCKNLIILHKNHSPC